MQAELNVVGRRLPLKESFEKVTGKAEYCTTVSLPGMLVGKVLRSPHAHARVLKVDTEKAEAIPGVQAVVTSKDVPRKIFSTNVMTYQLLEGEILDMIFFGEVVRYIGEPVAAVAAVNEEAARAALAAIDVKYEVLPGVYTMEDAAAEGAPQLHDNVAGNVPIPPTPVFCYGDAEKGFAESDVIVGSLYHTSKQIQAGLENACSVADYRNGRLTVWSQIQLPHMAKRMLAHMFDLSESQVRVIQPYAGCGFGAGTDLITEHIAAALSIKAGAPVKLKFYRNEDFTNRFTREHVAKIDMKLGLKKDGSPKALQARYTGDAGAYVCKVASGCGVALAANITEYEFENMHQEIEVIYSNHLPCGAMRGYGGMQSSFVRETLVDEACEKIGMDPIEFRKKYHRGVGGLGWFPSTAISSCGLDECLDAGAKWIGWKKKWGKMKGDGPVKRGVGVAAMGWLSGAQPMLLEHSNATLKFNEDGGCSLIVSPGNLGQGIIGSLSQIAAETLGIDYDDIRVVLGDTDVTGFDIGTHASRGCYCIGRAVQKAAGMAREKFLARAAEKLGVSADELNMKDKRIFVKADPSQGVSYRDIAMDLIYNFEKNCEQLVVHATVEPTEFAPPWQAGFAEVEVDTETGVVKLVRWVTVHDIGRAINPTVVEGQLEGGAAQGIGFALFEDPIIDPATGVMLTDGFDKYKLPTTLDMPEYEVVLVELGDPTGPFGAKSVGESGLFLQAPAVANAIYDAVGVRMREVPMTAEKVLAAIQAKA
ncbi:MAG: molybdopterin-dependent oxidoreductase [Desulfobacteraceae bacterium]|jgi:xanthine dehydrogenase molybdenum-binding subunit